MRYTSTSTLITLGAVSTSLWLRVQRVRCSGCTYSTQFLVIVNEAFSEHTVVFDMCSVVAIPPNRLIQANRSIWCSVTSDPTRPTHQSINLIHRPIDRLDQFRGTEVAKSAVVT